MTKRPSTPTGSPSAKRQELPSSWPSAPSLSHEILKNIVTKIKNAFEVDTVRPGAIFWRVANMLEDENYNCKGLVTQHQFEENLTLQGPHFLEVVKRGIAEDASQADLEAVVFHRTCFYMDGCR